MKHLIGGLFQTQESANQAYEALQRAGVAADDIRMLIHKPRRQVARSTDVSIQDIGRNAFIGGLIGAGLGALVGLLVGLGVLPHPYLEPGSAPRDGLFIFMSIVWGLIPGGLIGTILGTASRLLVSREKAEVVTEEIEKRGVLVTIGVNGSQSENGIRQILQDHGAVEIGKPSETWDPEAWVNPNEANASLRNSAGSSR